MHRKLQITEITSRGSYFVGLVPSPKTFGLGFVLSIVSASRWCHLTPNPLPNITLSHRADSGPAQSKQALCHTTDLSSSFPSCSPTQGVRISTCEERNSPVSVIITYRYDIIREFNANSSPPPSPPGLPSVFQAADFI